MKTLYGTLLLLLWISPAAAQDPNQSDPPNLSVIEKSWSRVFYYPNRDPNPLGPNESHRREVRLQKAAIKRRDENTSKSIEESIPFVTPVPLATRMERLTRYEYTVKVKNTGPKTIKTIYWEYQFLDPDTQQVMGHRRTASSVKILSGETQVLQRFSNKQPSLIVSANQLHKKYRDQFTERVIIHRINFTDGSVWKLKR
jgi:hypothetical protein